MPHTISPSKKTLTLQSVELLNSTLQPWGLDFIQLQKGQFTTQLEQLVIEQNTLQRISFDKQVWQRGVAPKECLNIGLLAQNIGETNWNNQFIDLNTIEIFSNCDGFDVVSPAGFEAYTLSLHHSLVYKTIEQGKLNLNPEKLLAEHQVFTFSTQFTQQIKMLLSHILSEQFQRSNQLCKIQALFDLNHQLLSQFESHKQTEKAIIRQSRQKVISRALTYIDASLHQPISLSDICLASHTSLRTLDRCFKEKFQTSPTAIITLLRMYAFRKLLIKSPKQKIYYLAGLCGFWHMGKLGADYKRMFGELPSQTQKNK